MILAIYLLGLPISVVVLAAYVTASPTVHWSSDKDGKGTEVTVGILIFCTIIWPFCLLMQVGEWIGLAVKRLAK